MKLLPLFTLFGSLLFPVDADHLLLIRVVTQPDAAESFSIYNPTDSPINLSNYYISEEEDYFKIQSVGNMSPSHFLYGFTARFPDLNIEPNDTLIIGLNYRYKEFYGEDNPADLVMYLDQVNSMIETEDKSFGIPFSDIDGDDNDFGNISADSCNTVGGIWHGNEGDDTAFCGDGIGCNGTEITYCNDENSSNCIEECDDINPIGKFDDGTEMLILFYWDGNSNNLIQDVDYFLWGDSLNSMDKSEVPDYQNDTSADDQLFFEEIAENYYAYSRIGTDEVDETQTGGNGITGHDETSENFRESWEVKEIFKMGCTDSDAPNFDPNAEIDDGNCALNFEDVINNCISEPIACEDGYDLSDPPQCPLYNNRVTIVGTIIDYYDITPNNGPYSFTLEDPLGYRISFVVWPESSSYQDGFDITQSAFSILTQSPFERFKIQISGKLDVYCRSGIELNIFNDWQVVVEYESDISIIEEIDMGGFFTEDNIKIVEIKPAPFVLIPTIGETLDYTYSHPGNSRIIIRIFDLSGRFITSLLDKYVIKSGTWSNGFNPTTGENSSASAWDGRDHLGQIVAAGTYIMHIEAMNPVTGETHTDAAPVVVGVKN